MKLKKNQSTLKKSAHQKAMLATVGCGPFNQFASSYYAKVVDLTDQENMVKSKSLRDQI